MFLSLKATDSIASGATRRNFPMPSVPEGDEHSTVNVRPFQGRQIFFVGRRVAPDAIIFVAFSDFRLMSTEPNENSSF